MSLILSFVYSKKKVPFFSFSKSNQTKFRNQKNQMRIDHLIGLWNPINCVVLVLITIPVIVFGDAFAAKFIAIHQNEFKKHDLQDEQKLIISILPQDSSLHSFPNFWIWYEGSSIRDTLRTQMDSHIEFLLLTVYNAALATNVVFMTLLTLTMTWANYCFPDLSSATRGRIPRRIISPSLCVFSFLMDIGEDILLVVITVGFPHTVYPNLEILCSWCSFLKFVGWFAIILWWILMGLKVIVVGRNEGERKENGKQL